MAIIACPKCKHSALWVADKILLEAQEHDVIKSRDFRVIYSGRPPDLWPRPDRGYIRCSNCMADLSEAIRNERLSIRERYFATEWDR